jgi:hypothetical protein
MARTLARISEPHRSGPISTAQNDQDSERQESLSHVFGVSSRKPRKGWKVLAKCSLIKSGIGKNWDSGLEAQVQSERATLSFQSCLRWSQRGFLVDSRPCDVKSHAGRISAEAQIGTATDDSKAIPLVKSSSKVGGTEPAGSNNGVATKARIASEAAIHFKQFETVLTVVGGYDRAVNAEVGYSGPAQSYDNSTWPVLLGLAEVSANKATKGDRSAEVICPIVPQYPLRSSDLDTALQWLSFDQSIQAHLLFQSSSMPLVLWCCNDSGAKNDCFSGLGTTVDVCSSEKQLVVTLILQSQLKEVQAQRAAKDASWTVEKAEMRVSA